MSLLLVLAVSAFGEPVAEPPSAVEQPQPSDPFSDVLRVADGLSDSGYPRDATSLVIQQLERHPDHPDAPEIRLRISRIQRSFGFVAEEVATLERGAVLHAGDWNPWFELARMDAMLQSGDFGGVRLAMEQQVEWAPSVTDAVHYYGAWGRFSSGDEPGAETLLAKVRGPLQGPAAGFARTLDVTPIRRRSVVAASGLSLLPGLGQAYAGEPVAGVGALVVTGGLGGAALFFHQREQPVTTAVFGVLGGLSWLSNILRAGSAAQRFNENEVAMRAAMVRSEFWPTAELTDDSEAPLRVNIQGEE